MIDKNPAPGRFIFPEPVAYQAVVAEEMLVTRVDEHRIYAKRSGKAREVQLYSFVVCCDTLDEIAAIKAVAARSVAEHERIYNETRAAMRALLNNGINK